MANILLKSAATNINAFPDVFCIFVNVQMGNFLFNKPNTPTETLLLIYAVSSRGNFFSQIYSFFTYFVQAVENQKIQMLGTILELKI